jgi:hypothetical protein
MNLGGIIMKKTKKTARKSHSVKPVPKSESLLDKKIDSATGITIIIACFIAALVTIRYVTDLAGILIKSQVFYY